MGKDHLKRLTTPSSWPTKRKDQKYIQRPNAGSKELSMGMSLGVVLRDVIGITKTAKESGYLLHKGAVHVNGVTRRDSDYLVCVFDVIALPDNDKYFRGTVTKSGKIAFTAIDKKQAALIPRRVRNKRYISGGKMQVNFFDGHNTIVDKADYKVGDTIVFSTADKKQDVLAFQPGSTIFLIGGSHVGEHGVLEAVLANRISFKATDGNVYETARDYAVVVGKEKPVVQLGDA